MTKVRFILGIRRLEHIELKLEQQTRRQTDNEPEVEYFRPSSDLPVTSCDPLFTNFEPKCDDIGANLHSKIENPTSGSKVN